jgi:hypothetical protein
MLDIQGLEIIGGLETVDVSVPPPASGYGSVTSFTVAYAGGAPILGATSPLMLPAHGEVAT